MIESSDLAYRGHETHPHSHSTPLMIFHSINDISLDIEMCVYRWQILDRQTFQARLHVNLLFGKQTSNIYLHW